MTLLEPPAQKVPDAIPSDVKARMDRGRKAMMQDAPKRRLCARVRKGDQYWYLTGQNVLSVQGTAVGPGPNGGKPGWRVRNRYDFVGPIIDAKVSVAVARIPDYQINPSKQDMETVGAAKMATKVARFGYDKWRLRKASIKAVDTAIGRGGKSYTMPYFDPNVGPYVNVDGKEVGVGEVKVLVLNGNQVYSEPGVDFDESPWWAIERARPLDEIREIPGFVAGELKADASTSDIPIDRSQSDNLAMVIEYFERPSPKYPEGRCMTFSSSRAIVDYRLIDPTATNFWGGYPNRDAQNRVVDEPILHELVYRHDLEDGSDLGLTWALIDFQRTIQDCYNKILEFKNRRLFPQMTAVQGSILTPRTDEYGAIIYYKPGPNGERPEWEPIDSSWLSPLVEIKNQAIRDMRDVAAASDAQADPRVAATTVQAVGQQELARWEMFLGDLAEWHSRVMRHCLLLVARHYTEPRLLAIRGRWGQPQNMQDFQGADLLGQADVTVFPDSLVPRTRQQVMSELAWIQANFPGYLTPEVAIAALQNGTAEDLIRGYDLDMGRVNEIIQAILDGTVLNLPDRLLPEPGPVDPITGQPGAPVLMPVPSYMPTEQDAVPIWKRMFGDFMKTHEFQRLPPAMQEVANQIWVSLTNKELAQAQRQQLLQIGLARSQGMEGAAAPQTKGMPSQPGDGVSPSPNVGAVQSLQ